MRTLLLLVLSIISTFAFSKEPAKHELFVAEGRYSVDFSGIKPQSKQDTLNGQNDSATRTFYVVEAQPAMRMLGTVVPDKGVAPDSPENYYDSMVENVKNGMPGLQIVKNQPTTLDGRTGREIVARSAQGTIIVKTFVTKRAMVLVQAVFPTGSTAGQTAANHFVNSLKITAE